MVRSAIRDPLPSEFGLARSSQRVCRMDSEPGTTTVQSQLSERLRPPKRAQRSHRMRRHADTHRNRTSSSPAAQTPRVSSNRSSHRGSPHTRVQGNPHGLTRRRTTSSICRRDTQGSVRKRFCVPILHWQRTQVQFDPPTALHPIAKSQSCTVPRDSLLRLRNRCVLPTFLPQRPIPGRRMGSAVHPYDPNCFLSYEQQGAASSPPSRD